MFVYNQEHTFFQLVKLLCVVGMKDCGSGVVLQRAALAVTVLALWSSSGSGFNIDTLQPIVRDPPADHSGQDLTEESYTF